jgi:hypothetical protein
MPLAKSRLEWTPRLRPLSVFSLRIEVRKDGVNDFIRAFGDGLKIGAALNFRGQRSLIRVVDASD